MNEKERGEVVNFRINKAFNTFREIPQLIALGYFNNAVNRIYYACFYAASALLLQQNLQSKTHAGVRNLLSLHFIQPGILAARFGKFYSRVFDERWSSDYEDFAEFDKETVEAFLQKRANFLMLLVPSSNQPETSLVSSAVIAVADSGLSISPTRFSFPSVLQHYLTSLFYPRLINVRLNFAVICK